MLTPGVAPVWTNPTYIAESRLRARVGECLAGADIRAGEVWVDVGCGTRPYESLFPRGVYFGVDVPSSGRSVLEKCPDAMYDGMSLPFAASSLDGVLCTQVLEHVRDPHALLSEFKRALKAGGLLVVSAPFLWQEHEQPHDFQRFTSFGIRELLTAHGFEITRLAKSCGSLEALAQAASTYAANSIRLSVPGFGRIVTLLVCLPLQLAGIALQRILPDRGELYLDCILVARKIG